MPIIASHIVVVRLGIWYNCNIITSSNRVFDGGFHMEIVEINQHNFTDVNKANQPF